MMPLALENEVVIAGKAATVADLVDRGTARLRAWSGRSVAIVTDDPAEQIAAVAAGDALRLRLLVASTRQFNPNFAPQIEASVDVIVERGAPRPTRAPGVDGDPVEEAGLVLLTSGTTGPPKLVRHGYDTINTYERVAVEPNRWICTYEPGTYAWFQVVMLVLTVPGQKLILPPSTSAEDIYRTMVEHQVTAVPSTPSFWRYVLATVPLAELGSLPIRRITLGGERADQPILDDLHRLYPEAKLTHVFAATETGAAIIVSDGRAGFPAEWLERSLLGGRVRLRIRDGTLWINSPYRHRDGDEWIDTGDEVESSSGRVHYLGRRGERTINVGGTKVASSVLEDLVAAIDGVVWAQAHPRAAPIVGNLVALAVVLDRRVWPGEDDAERHIRARCREQLPEAYEPRWIEFLDEVPLGPNQKADSAVRGRRSP